MLDEPGYVQPVIGMRKEWWGEIYICTYSPPNYATAVALGGFCGDYFDQSVHKCINPGPAKGNGPPPCYLPTTPHPITISNGNKWLTETDIGRPSGMDTNTAPKALKFSRTYNSNPNTIGAVFGAGWSNDYGQHLAFHDSGNTVWAFRPDGKLYKLARSGNSYYGVDADIADHLYIETDTSGLLTGYSLETGNVIEHYDTAGRLNSIIDVLTGQKQTVIYDSMHRLAEVADGFGRKLTFTYGFRTTTLTDPAGGTVIYSYDGANNLATVSYQDGKLKTYHYNEPANTSGANLPNAMTGISDENGIPYVSYSYDATGRAYSEQLSGGVDSYVINFGTNSSTVTDPLGTVRTHNFQNILDIAKVTGQSQPAGTGCLASAASLGYDTNGNVANRTDFNDNVNCFSYDLTRNLETARIEGMAPGSSCPTDVAGYVPAANTVERKRTTAWHPDWRLEVQRAEPKKLTTWVYNGQPDPTDGNAVASCAPATALLPDGKPIAVLCKKVEQATTDATGASGLAATVTGSPRVWSYSYNEVGQVLTIDGPRTDVTDTTTYAYYPDTTADHHLGDLASVSDALGHVTNYTSYDAHGHPLTITDANGLTTTLEYYPRGWLKTKTVGGELTSYGYDNVGQLTSVTQPDGSGLTYFYDDAHRLTEIHDVFGGKIVYTLDAMGNRKQEDVYDPTGTLKRSHQRVYDALNRLWKDIGADPAHQVTEYGYDANGNRTTVTDPLNQATTNVYDPLNRLIQVLQPIPAVGQPRPETRYGYDGLDQLVKVTDPRNLDTNYTLDGLGNRTQLASSDSGATDSSYDEAGNLKTRTDAKRQLTTYSYDELNRAKTVLFHDGSRQVYSYDQGINGIGRLTSLAEYDPAGTLTNQIDYGYDTRGRLTAETRSFAGTTAAVHYHYDAGGRLDQITYPSGRTVTYGFDLMGRIQRIDTTAFGQTTAQNVVADIQYQPFGGVAGYSYGNGQAYQRHYDLDGRLQDYTQGTSTVTAGYDAASQLKTLTDSLSGQVRQYDYDPLGRLISATTPTSGHGYDYDAVGNRIAQTGDSLVSYGYPPDSNRLDTVNGATQSYDANGSLTASSSIPQLTHDVRGRLVQTDAGGLITTYQIDALGRRIRKTNLAGDTLFHYDLGGRLIAETTAGGILLKEYLYLNDLPVAVVAQ